jgi:hypothetical protein
MSNAIASKVKENAKRLESGMRGKGKAPIPRNGFFCRTTGVEHQGRAELRRRAQNTDKSMQSTDEARADGKVGFGGFGPEIAKPRRAWRAWQDVRE